jgi:hypothetical protein
MLVLLLGCTKLEVEYSPSNITWGDINFANSMPEDGYSEVNIQIQNMGEKQISLFVSGFNKEYFCVLGEEEDSVSIEKLETNQIFEVSVSICDYIEENGERDTNITGEFQLFEQNDSTNTVVGTINWSFTPVINLLEDSG